MLREVLRFGRRRQRNLPLFFTAATALCLLSDFAEPSDSLPPLADNPHVVCKNFSFPDPSPNPAPALDARRPFYFDIGPQRYAIPWLYLWGRPRPNVASCLMTQRSIGFQFRYKTADPARGHDIAYAYDGPELISQVPIDRVRVFDFSYYDDAPDDYHSPASRFDNLLSGLPANASRVRFHDLEVVQINHAGHTAWHGQTEYTEVYFTCILPFICTGFLDLKDLKVSASIVASRQAVPDFWTLEKRLRSLLGEWEIH